MLLLNLEHENYDKLIDAAGLLIDPDRCRLLRIVDRSLRANCSLGSLLLQSASVPLLLSPLLLL